MITSDLHACIPRNPNSTNALIRAGLPQINDPQYAFYPGSFPIIISGVGVVGSVTVAGSNLRADHDIIITALERFSSDQPPLNEQIALDISGSRTGNTATS